MLFHFLFALSVSAGHYMVKIHPQSQAEFIRTYSNSEKVADNVFRLWLDDRQLTALTHSENIEHIESDDPIHLHATPNDLHSTLWGLKNSEGIDINAEKVWDITTGSKDVVVAVIDTGAALRHPDLRDNLWVNTKEQKGEKGVDDDGNGFVDDIHGYQFALNQGSPMDQRGHGTHVAGSIGAVGNNGRNLVGVNWSVSLMALNMFPRYFSAQESDAIRAIDYAIKNGAHIINASWGKDGEGEPDDRFLKEAIERSSETGIVFVSSAGNDGAEIERREKVPATWDIPNIISVGSIDRYGNLSDFSNFGRTAVDVLAPGSDIMSLDLRGRSYKSGTSMAAPYVSGIVALMLSVNPDLKVAEVKDILINSCKKRTNLSLLSACGGYIDAAEAVKRAQSAGGK